MFDSIINTWLEDVDRRVDLSPSTKVTYARIGAHLMGLTTMDDGDVIDLTPYVVERLEAGAAPRTIALELRVAAAAVRWARRTRRVPLSLELHVPRDPSVRPGGRPVTAV